MIKQSTLTEKHYLSKIKNDLMYIKTIADQSNNAQIAFIIASAIAIKFHRYIDQRTITHILNEKTLLKNKVSLLDIKQVLHELNFSTDAVKATDPLALQYLSHEILITQDIKQNFIALAGLFQNNLHFIYGKFEHEVLLCSVNKSSFIDHYSNNKFLILK